MMPLVVSIGTTHPWNIAGVGLDAHVARALGCAHAAVVVAVSAQGLRGVTALAPLDPATVRAQIADLPAPVAAYRIGALVSPAIAEAVIDALSAAPAVPVVIDPVLRASLGGALAHGGGLTHALAGFAALPRAYVTPNLEEAAALCRNPIPTDEAEMAALAGRLVERGFVGAVVTGGHLPGDPVDVAAERGVVTRLPARRLPGSMRGTGCVFAAALACKFALGSAFVPAAESAQAYVRARIAEHVERGGLQVAF